MFYKKLLHNIKTLSGKSISITINIILSSIDFLVAQKCYTERPCSDFSHFSAIILILRILHNEL